MCGILRFSKFIILFCIIRVLRVSVLYLYFYSSDVFMSKWYIFKCFPDDDVVILELSEILEEKQFIEQAKAGR